MPRSFFKVSVRRSGSKNTNGSHSSVPCKRSRSPHMAFYSQSIKEIDMGSRIFKTLVLYPTERDCTSATRVTTWNEVDCLYFL